MSNQETETTETDLNHLNQPLEGFEKPAKEPEEGQQEEETEEVAEEVEEISKEEDKPKKKLNPFEKRLKQLSTQRDEERAKNVQLMAMLEQSKKPEQPAVKPSEDGEPDISSYTDEQIASGTYMRDVAKYEGKRAYQEEKAKDKETTKKNAEVKTATDARQNYVSSLGEAANKYEDFEEVLDSSVVEFNNHKVQLSIMKSKNPGELAYYLAKNPDEALAISKMDEMDAIMSIGELNGKLSSSGLDRQPKKVSKHKNITPVGTKSSTANKGYKPGMSIEDFNKEFPPIFG